MARITDRALKGKLCLLTGATGGIGAVTARRLAELGASLILVARSADRGAALVETLKSAAGDTPVEFLQADLSSQTEVRRLAGEVARRHDHLDILINNAGGLFGRRRESADGIEMTFALNHLSYFLLTTLLLDRLKAAAEATTRPIPSARLEGATTLVAIPFHSALERSASSVPALP